LKVLVANPPAYFDDHKRHFIQGGSRWSFSIFVPRNFKEHYLPYPFRLAYTSSLHKSTTDANVRGIDACALDLDQNDFVRLVNQFHPDLLLMDAPTISFPLVMRMLKEVKEQTGCEIALADSPAVARLRRSSAGHEAI